MADTLTPNIKLTNQEEGTNLNTWGLIADANFERIDDKFGDVVYIDTSGGDIRLTDAQEVVNAIEIEGTLAANANIIFSGRGGSWTIRNDATGPFTVTCKVSGRPGVVIAQGTAKTVYCNGTDIKLANGDAAAAPETNVASSATADILGAPSEFVNLTGAATITSFGVGPNRRRYVRCSGACRIAPNGLSLITPTGRTIDCEAGDTFIVVADAASNARIWLYNRGGRALEPDHDIGDTVWKMRTGPLTRHLICNGTTIGNAGSGATQLEGPDAEALFKILYARYPNSICPVSGGRGASANTDWLGAKTIALPDGRGRGAFGLDDMGATAAGRISAGTPTVAGSSGGGETKAILIGNMPLHAHGPGTLATDTSGNHQHSVYQPGSVGGVAGTDNGVVRNLWQGGGGSATGVAGNHAHVVNAGTTGNAGSGDPLNVMPPYWLGTWYMRYK